MTTKPEFVQLEAGDDVVSVRDRLSFLRGKRVLLIWPEDGTVLTRKLDLVLIQREAMRRAIRLALVTHDTTVIQHANELNISTFETIGASERGRWRRGRGKVFANRAQRPKDEPIPDDLKEIASRIYAEESAAERRWRRIRFAIGLLLFAAIALGIGYVFLPTATVRLTPAQRRIEASASIRVDPLTSGVDVENAIIPALRLSIQIEDSGTIETSGVQALGDAAASGSVVFINQTEQPVTIPAGTTVSTSAGEPISFRTAQEASLPGGIGLQVEVPIEALPGSAGAVGNVDSGQINTVIGPLSAQVTVRNIVPTAGGTSRSQRIVTQTDRDLLLATVKQQLQTRAYLDLQARLSESQCIILETMRIAEERSDWTTFSANIGEISDTLSLTMRVVVEATAIEEQFGRQIVYAQMSQQVQSEEAIQPESVTYDLGCEAVSSSDSSTGQATFTMSSSGLVTAVIDTEAVRQRLAGLSLNDAVAYLVSELPLQQGTQPGIRIEPDWFSGLPLLPFRISVALESSVVP
jgi:hypothetical protein